MRVSIFLVFISVFFNTNLLSQKTLQSPEAFLPTDYGKHFTPHHLLVDYFEHVAENSDQVILREYGKTNQKRPLIWAIISSPENLKNLETIRTDNLKRAGLMEGKPSEYKPVAIVWLSYGVHGNEAGGSESSLATVYELTRPNNQKVQALLENSIVIMDPSINPDGYSRYTHWNWNTSNLIPNPNPESREHNEPWPGGRVNHYLFDLNRDWAWQTQIETQQRLEIYHQWMPHIHVDYHEQGHNSPYYFAPAAQPYHQFITDWQSDFQHDIGKNHAHYFDENGWLYFTKEVFDLFYPSYGDTYPIFNGAIGMTHEQAGHSRAGRAILMDNGDTLTIQDRIDHHVATGISNIEISAKNADRLISNFENYFKASINQPQGNYKTFIIAASNNKAKLKSLCAFMDKHRIQYGKAGKAKKGTSVYNYISNSKTNYDIKPNDLVISAYQAKGVLTQVLFEPDPFLIDSLTYDITAWSLPHALGLEAYASTQRLNPESDYTLDPFAAPTNYGKPYAYLAHWQSLADARFLGELLNSGIKVRTTAKSFKLSGSSYPAGTLVITRADNRKNNSFDKIVQSIAAENEKTLIPAKTGLADEGHDLGSANMMLLNMPKIAMLYGDRVSGNAFGHTWHYFEQDLNYPVTMLSDKQFAYANLDNYNVILMQEGSYNLNKSNSEKLKNWISKGGRLIAIGRAISSLAGKDGFEIKRKSKEENKMSSAEQEARKTNHKLENYGDQERNSISDQMPGAIFKLKIDNTHPLAFGLPDYYFSLKTSSANYALLEDGWNVGYIPNDLTVLGFAGANVKKRMKETVVLGTQSMGSGKVIYMVDNPTYRGFWRQGKFLLSNAIFMAQ